MTFPFSRNRFFGLTGVNALPEHDRWPGVQAVIPITEIRLSINQSPETGVSEIMHPQYQMDADNWTKWELVYDGGEDFVQTYTKKFSRRESGDDFTARKEITPIPVFAKSAVDEIKNSIFQRMTDVRRTGGPKSYLASCDGKIGGVDRRGASMTWFLGHHVLPQLLTMKKVGVYVDNNQQGPTLADKSKTHPYLYVYKAQDIRSWQELVVGTETVYQELLLREYVYTRYDGFNLPSGTEVRFRHMFIANDGFVHVQYYNALDEKDGPELTLTIKKIPFVLFELSDSLLKNVANHQIALLNLESSDMSYTLLANYPLYTEQYDPASENGYLRRAQEENWGDTGTVLSPDPAYANTCPPKTTENHETRAGSAQGRRYPKGLERPNFVAPPTEPLKASMEKQDRLKEDVRKLVHLALSSLQPKMASAESKQFDQSGLESGLSYIGLELEHGERQIAMYWAIYENDPNITEVNYPKHWSLKSQEELDEEVERLEKLRDSVPSRAFQKEVTKKMAVTVLGTSVPEAVLNTILKEIDDSELLTADPDTLINLHKSGLVPGRAAAKAIGISEKLYQEAQEERKERAKEILATQAPKKDPAAAGVPEISNNLDAGSREKDDKPKRGPE